MGKKRTGPNLPIAIKKEIGDKIMIDLHLHTNHSDGTDTVTELLEKAEQQKLEIISIFTFAESIL